MNTYPHDYIEWCFGSANNISEYTKAKQLELMEDGARYEAMRQASYYNSLAPCYPSYNASEYEPVPQYQRDTDNITKLLEA